jgi:DNA-binding SARP family transcriptional activator
LLAVRKRISKPMSRVCRIRLLGGLSVQQGEQRLSRFRARATGLMLAYLAFYCHKAHTREALQEMLWPDLEPKVGSARFRPELSWLRRHLEPPGSILYADRQTVRLNPKTTTDVGEFLDAWQTASRAASEAEQLSALERAVALFSGELLPGYYEDWVLAERERLEEAYLNVLQAYAATLAATGDLQGALRYGGEAVRRDPLREETRCDLMRYFAAAGQPSAVPPTFD